MANIRINDIVINPQFGANELLDDLFGPAEKTLSVVLIVERDMGTDERGYTKKVSESSADDAYVTLDGGRNWQHARIDGPVLDKSLTRFYVDFDWTGQDLLIQSRAMDSTGYLQPTKEELRKIRGTNSIYHNNGIQTWHVKANGETENVEIA